MIYQSNESSENNNEQIERILAFINDFGNNMGVNPVTVDIQSVTGIVRSMHHKFPHKAGVENASVFKKAANFLCLFIAQRPVESILPETYSVAFSEIPDSLNTILAFEIVRESLKGARIKRLDGTEFILENRIALSKHSYIDIIDALTHATPSSHFKLVSVLLEQLAYKTNPKCQYPTT